METRRSFSYIRNNSRIPILPMRHGNGGFWAMINTGYEFIPILPMRHGNSLTWLLCFTISAFRSYLWGMETWGEIEGVSDWRAFRSYLWGMETVDPKKFILFAPGFRSYLWGMETWLRGFSIWPKIAYSDPTYEAWKRNFIWYPVRHFNNIPILPMRHGN